MFLLKKIRAEQAAKIIAGYCNKQNDCNRCLFRGNEGGCKLSGTIPMNWEASSNEEKDHD